MLRELRVYFGAAEDEDRKAQINILEKAFRGAVTAAVHRELNRLRANSLTGEDLFKALTTIYHQHSMGEWIDRREQEPEAPPLPRIICSEALL